MIVGAKNLYLYHLNCTKVTLIVEPKNLYNLNCIKATLIGGAKIWIAKKLISLYTVIYILIYPYILWNICDIYSDISLYPVKYMWCRFWYILISYGIYVISWWARTDISSFPRPPKSLKHHMFNEHHWWCFQTSISAIIGFLEVFDDCSYQ